LAHLVTLEALAVATALAGLLVTALLIAMGHERREKLWTKVFGGWLA
jgi:hypothetical protein